MGTDKRYRDKVIMVAGISAILLFVLLCVCCMYFAYRLFFFGRNESYYVKIPDLVGISEDELCFYPDIDIIKNYEYSDDANAGRIMSQSACGSRKVALKDRYLLYVTVGRGKRREIMPDLTGMTKAEAEHTVRSLGARMDVRYIISDIKKGVVVRQYPYAQEYITEGESVTVFISEGIPSESIAVPLLEGELITDAIRIANESGIRIRNITYVHSCDVCDGCIMSQSVPDGAYVYKGSGVDITVSRYPRCEMKIEKESRINIWTKKGQEE